MENLKIGLIGTTTLLVEPCHTAKAVQSGGLDVLATPVLITLAEKTAWQSVKPLLEDGSDTVGTHINIEHLSPTPVGMKIHCKTCLTAIDGRKLCFTIEVFDEAGLIAQGTHERFIILADKFQTKADSKKGN